LATGLISKLNVFTMSLAIYRTYRPSTFAEVTGQEHVVRTIQNQYVGNSLAHAYLFTGPRGVGKTTIARLLAKLVNCEGAKDAEPCNKCDSCKSITAGNAMDVYELDAASHTDVENVRETIIQAVRFAPSKLKKKVYIIDEVHMLSASAFNALLKTLEEPPDHAMFILATTEIHKVPETIISRCQRFDFKKIAVDVLIERLSKIVKGEGVKVNEDVLREIARHSGGCARDAESLLGQVLALGEKNIGMEEASLVLPATQRVLVDEFIGDLEKRDACAGITHLNTYLEQGVDLQHFVCDVIDDLRERLLCAIGKMESEIEIGFLERAIEELLRASREIRADNIPQLPVELAVMRICGLSCKAGAEAKIIVESEETKDIKKKDKECVNDKPEIVKAVFDTVPIISLDEVKNQWPQIYEQIKSCNASLPLMMKDCEVCGVESGQVEIAFGFDLYVQTVNQEKNRKVIEGVLEKVLGKHVRIRAVHKRQDNAVVDELLGAFGGSTTN
jgi:DNA polymerase-3 subunit gamma/tau